MSQYCFFRGRSTVFNRCSAQFPIQLTACSGIDKNEKKKKSSCR